MPSRSGAGAGPDGVQNAGGIQAIKLSNTSGGIELDHVQYGRMPVDDVPEPVSLALLGLGLAGAGLARICRR